MFLPSWSSSQPSSLMSSLLFFQLSDASSPADQVGFTEEGSRISLSAPLSTREHQGSFWKGMVRERGEAAAGRTVLKAEKAARSRRECKEKQGQHFTSPKSRTWTLIILVIPFPAQDIPRSYENHCQLMMDQLWGLTGRGHSSKGTV